MRVSKRFAGSGFGRRDQLHVLIDTDAEGTKRFQLCLGSASFHVTQAEADFLHQHAGIPLRDLQSEPPRCV
jgi:hypothetical protein